MTSKEKIFANLNPLHNDPVADKPDLSFLSPTSYQDPLKVFIETSQTNAGANVIELNPDEDINQRILLAYPEAKIIASNIPDIKANLNPDAIKEKSDLLKVDVGVVEGKIGVAENGCVWVPQTMKERAICFASENLIILLDKKSIVSNMHEAYRLISENSNYFSPYNFGTFISGPSKTADIEGALVFGAQGAKTLTLILL
ncbi:MAG: LUD domain-containing protein [Muribaculaceae bacterium]|nr:LUD domain-containing protein [Muribaculaceae bacterium]